jgi:Double sensory domain of two-component sensor kinase
MFLSKIWFILVALAAAIAVTFALIAPRPFERRLAALEGQRLDRAQYAAEQMFKVDAHKWIDHVSKLGRDAILAESLDAASRGSGEDKVIHRTIQDRFRTLIPDLASGGIDSIVATDTKGRVIARVGDNEKEYNDNMVGAEIIADALRGYLSDDVWGVGGRLQRLSAAPVLSKNRDRIVGSVYVSAETGPALVERLKKNLDVDVALLLRGKVIASSRGPGDLDALPDLVAQHTKEIETAKRTVPITMTVGKEDLLVVAAPFPGQAGEQQAYYALVGQHPANSGMAKLFQNATSDDLKWGRFPWLQLAGGVFLAIALGLFLQRREVDTPLRRLRRDLQKLASGDLQKVDDHRYGGNVGGLARDINAAIERYTHAPTQRSDVAGKDLNAILGPSGGSTFDLPAADSAFAGGTPPPAFAPPPSSSFSPPASSFSAPPLPTFSPPPAPSFAAPQPFSAASLGFGGSNSAPAEAAAPSDLPLPGTTKAAAWGASPSLGFNDQTHQDPPANNDGDATRVVPYDPGEEEEAHFRHIFDDFIAKKRDCGESTAGLTRDKFLQKLRENKASLVAKHNCRTVRFSVYIKDGKAALKATPIRE